MPTSFWKHLSYVMEHVREKKPKSILDIGIGNGKWGFLSREYLDIYGCGTNWRKDTWTTRIDGIEVYEPYIKENPSIQHNYNNVYVGNVLEILPTLQNYDMMFMMDVLEHIEKEEAVKLLNLILSKSKTFVLSVPLGDWRYTFKGENKAESHLSVWTEEELKLLTGYKEHQIYKLSTSSKREVEIGVFIFSK